MVSNVLEGCEKRFEKSLESKSADGVTKKLCQQNLKYVPVSTCVRIAPKRRTCSYGV